MHFYRLVSELQPLFFWQKMFRIMQEKYSGIRNKAFNLVSGDYDILDPIKVKASDYGAPTIRTRYFYRCKKSLKLDISDEVFMPKMIDPVTVKMLCMDYQILSMPIGNQTLRVGEQLKRSKRGFYENYGADPRNVGDTESIAKLKIISYLDVPEHYIAKSSKSVMLPYLWGN